MVILEGMDNTGKTTLAMKLSERFGAPFIRFPGPPENLEVLKGRLHFTRAIFDSAAPLVIFDRHSIISENVYGPILRNANWLERLQRQPNMSKLISSLWTDIRVLIYCRPPDEKIFKTLSKRDQMTGVVENKKLLLLAYDDFYHSFLDKTYQTKLLYFDYTEGSDYEVDLISKVHLRIKSLLSEERK